MQMDGRLVQPTLNGVAVQTSIELARKQTYSTTSIAGKKRVHDAISTVPSNEFRAALSESFNDAVPQAPLPPNSSISKHPSRLKASTIRCVTENGDAPAVSEWTQRKLAASTPRPSQNPLLTLGHPRYGLPKALVKNLESLGVHSIYPWQSSCLLGRGMLSGERNLVYTAPTGGGKSLVAEILMLKRIIEDPAKKAILVLPYVALVQEKMKWLRRVVEGVSRLIPAAGEEDLSRPSWQRRTPQSEIRVGGFFGGSKARSTWADIDIAVCTIEKANSLVNAAIDEGKIDQLGIVVLDELHMLNDEHRGYMMELMATKLLSLQHHVRIIGMSATLPNTELVAKWLDAKYYQSKYRPVPIEDFLVYEEFIYPASGSSTFLETASQLVSGSIGPSLAPTRTIEKSHHAELSNTVTNAVLALAVETAQAGYGALVFCSSRQACQTNAALISEAMPDVNSLDPSVLDKRKDVIADLQSLPAGIDPIFQRTITKGVAFHHAGLTTEEREIVAAAYDQGVLKVMVATCSLAAGINLPARRVILHGARMGREMVGPAMLRQMRGRAGRKGKDEVGESYVCCAKGDLEEVAALLEADLPLVVSSLTPEKRGLKRALLEVIATRLATSPESVNDYIQKTLLYQTMDHLELAIMAEATIKELLQLEAIRIADTGIYEPTLLGQAIVAASLTPEDGIFVHEELQRALRAFVMDGEMHIFYMFTPVQTSNLSEIVWPTFQKEMERLDESGIRALQFMGVKPSFVNAMVQTGATLRETTPSEITLARIYRRTYSAFQLRDLCNEVPIHAVARKYDTPRGFVQNLAQTCHSFGAGMIKFCERMGWGMMAAVLDHMLDRLKAGARADLLEMCQVVFVKSRMARMFWEHGFRSVRAIAEAERGDLVPILLLAQPRKMRLQGDAAEKYKHKLLDKAEIIVSSASRLWERQMRVEIDD